jgi:Tol biopolymer transport system component
LIWERIMFAKARRFGVWLAILVGASSLTGCGSGGGGTAPPAAPAGSHTLEALPYGQMGVGKIVFHRGDLLGMGWRDGIYTIEPVSKTSSFEFDGGGGWYPASPQVSPDGLNIAYTRWTDSTTLFDMYVANLDGSAARQVSAFPGQEGPPSWTPDGLQIVFYAAAQAGNNNLYRQPPVMPTASQRVQITSFSSTTNACPTFNVAEESVSVSPSGSFVWVCYLTNIEVTAPDGSATTAIYTLPPMNPILTELHASSWSPDGQRIAFLVLIRASSSMNQGIGERKQVLLKVIDPQGKNEQLLSTVASSGIADIGGQGNVYSLCWAADGSRIFFNVPDGTDGNEQAHIWVVNSDGSGLTQITNASGVWDHSVSCSR